MPGLHVGRGAGLAGQLAPVVAPVLDHVVESLVAGQVVGERRRFQRAVVAGPELRPAAEPGLGPCRDAGRNAWGCRCSNRPAASAACAGPARPRASRTRSSSARATRRYRPNGSPTGSPSRRTSARRSGGSSTRAASPCRRCGTRTAADRRSAASCRDPTDSCSAAPLRTATSRSRRIRPAPAGPGRRADRRPLRTGESFGRGGERAEHVGRAVPRARGQGQRLEGGQAAVFGGLLALAGGTEVQPELVMLVDAQAVGRAAGNRRHIGMVEEVLQRIALVQLLPAAEILRPAGSEEPLDAGRAEIELAGLAGSTGAASTDSASLPIPWEIAARTSAASRSTAHLPSRTCIHSPSCSNWSIANVCPPTYCEIAASHSGLP